MWYKYTVEYDSAIKKGNLAISWMDLEGIMLSEISGEVVNNYVMSLVTYHN